MPVESNELEEITKAQAQKAAEQPTVSVQRLDLSSLAETFDDSIDLVFFDGQTLRINFGVTRFGQGRR